MTEYEGMEGMTPEGFNAVESSGIGAKSTSLLDTLKENLSPDTLMQKIKTSKDKLFEIALYGGIGLVSGFLLKKYSTYVGVCVLLLIGLGVLHHLEVITVVINWDKVTEVFGIQAAPMVTADNLIAILWEWVKVNLLISISYVVGLFIGLKVG